METTFSRHGHTYGHTNDTRRFNSHSEQRSQEQTNEERAVKPNFHYADFPVAGEVGVMESGLNITNNLASNHNNAEETVPRSRDRHPVTSSADVIVCGQSACGVL